MMLVWNATKEGPSRLVDRVTSPFAFAFDGTGGYAWFDSLPDGASGQAGDIYIIEWVVDGDVAAGVEGKVKPENEHSSGVGSW